MPLWTWSELSLACAVDEPVSGSDINGISIDTRSLKPGDLFIALAGDPGPRFSSSIVDARDGHEFIEAAEAAGAAGLMVSVESDSSLPQLKVSNTLDGLWLIGKAGRERMEGKVVGITGSSGKTTARSWLEVILSRQAKTHASTGSLNNHWGVPLSLARMPADSVFGIFEIGMNSPGEIEPLSRLVAPDVAIVMNVLPAHLGNFRHIDEIRREKLSITQGLQEGGVLVVHEEIDLHDLPQKMQQSNIVTFGLSQSATVAAEVSYERGNSHVNVMIAGNEYSFKLSVGGEHRVLTSLACLAAVYALGADLVQACELLPQLQAPGGRGNLLEVSGRIIIDDSYNANPVSMKYALEALSLVPQGRKIALLGEMLELGESGKAAHRAMIESCRSLDGVLTFGKGFEGAEDTLGNIHWGHYSSVAELNLDELAEKLEEGDTILIKGANKVFWVNKFVEALCAVLN
jgi:UDP-N-acetylmuramoyl-tripeptide--D-alanyl-D-alanine ligase